VAGVEQRIEPLEARYARAGESGDPRLDRGEASLEIVDQSIAIAVAPECRGDAPDILEHPFDARRIQRDHLRLTREACRDPVQCDRADGAQGLPEDQVGPRIAQGVLVEMERALAARARVAYQPVYLACACAGRDCRSRDPRKVQDRRREIVVVRDRDELIHRAERPDNFRRRGDERDDTHGR